MNDASDGCLQVRGTAFARDEYYPDKRLGEDLSMKVAVSDKEASKRKGYHQSILRMEAKHQSHDAHNCLDPVKRIPVRIVLSEGDSNAHVENSLDAIDLPLADISSPFGRVHHFELSQLLPRLSIYIYRVRYVYVETSCRTDARKLSVDVRGDSLETLSLFAWKCHTICLSINQMITLLH